MTIRVAINGYGRIGTATSCVPTTKVARSTISKSSPSTTWAIPRPTPT
ncbi:hypothetical protein WJ970_13075 [Achromobacter xylosoxidans]